MSGDSLTTVVTKVTPALAEEWLTHNIKNRNPKPAKIAQYAEDIRAGNWKVNGESLKFTHAGRLLDGQNRLLACITANTPFTTLVVRGLDDVDQDTLDGCARRSYADVLRMRGEPNADALAAAVRSLHGWLRGIRRFDGGGVDRAASNAMLDVALEKHPEVRENITAIKRVARAVHIPVSVLGALWWAFNDIDPEDAEFFFTRLCSDEGHYAGEPIFALRRALGARKERAGTYANPTFVAALTVKAWNAYRIGTEVQMLLWRPGGAHHEKFPEPK